MKKYALVAIAIATLALSACDGSRNDSFQPHASEMATDIQSAGMQESKMRQTAPDAPPMSPPPPEQGGAVAPAGPMLAYSHYRSIDAPANAVAGIADAHRIACDTAGPNVCMVVSIGQSGSPEDDWVSANLYLKATPAWSQTFLSGLESSMTAAKGRIVDASTQAEDLSTRIVDTDARLKAQITLRDRLQRLLTDRPSELGDLLALERELARVQADIDSQASILAALRQRVAMSDIRLNYSTRQSPVSQSVWRPLGDAFNGFFGNVARILAAIVTFLPFAIFWIPVGIGLIWVARKLWVRVFRKPGAVGTSDAKA